MKLPQDVIVPQDKLTQYLLARRPRNDKSLFLERAGYALADWRRLEADIRELARNSDAESGGNNAYGEFLIARGVLQGPNGVILKVKTVWIQLARTGEMRFVTLVPDPGRP